MAYKIKQAKKEREVMYIPDTKGQLIDELFNLNIYRSDADQITYEEGVKMLKDYYKRKK